MICSSSTRRFHRSPISHLWFTQIPYSKLRVEELSAENKELTLTMKAIIAILYFSILDLACCSQNGGIGRIPIKHYGKHHPLANVHYFLQINAALLVALPQVAQSQVLGGLLPKRMSDKGYNIFHPGISQPDIFYPDW